MNTKAFTKADSSEILRATQVYANVSSGELSRSSKIPIPVQSVLGELLWVRFAGLPQCADR